MYAHNIFLQRPWYGKSMEPPQCILISDNTIFVNCYTKLHLTEEVFSISNRSLFQEEYQLKGLFFQS